MGEDVISLALEHLKNGEYSFHLILSDLVKDPPKIVANGDMYKIRNSWLEWGKNHGYGG
jgi:hypothetical protein